MKKLDYDFPTKKQASTLCSLGLSELEAAEVLVEKELYREAIVHMYFTCYYISQALLLKQLGRKTSHKHVESQLHLQYGSAKDFPRRYVDLHSFLHKLRTKFNYKHTHVPSPRLIARKLNILRYYVKFAFKVIPRIETLEIVKWIYDENKDKIKDFSYDIYCPKTYSHHTRITFWQPPFYLDLYTPDAIKRNLQKVLRNLRVKKVKDYVIGLNSRLDQYKPVHLLMLDIDTLDNAVEDSLKQIGGILLKTGRGFHFIGKQLIVGQKEWVSYMKKMRKHSVLKNYLDKDHIEISLRRGYGTLRISSSPIKPTVPVFYKELW